MNVKFLTLSAIILIASFLELIVFNEEVLLALCFISFVFFSYCFLADNVTSIFTERAGKFKLDIAVAFDNKLTLIIETVNGLVHEKKLTRFIGFIDIIQNNTWSLQYSDRWNEQCAGFFWDGLITKLNKVVAIEQKLKLETQKQSIQSLVYPFVFTLIKRNTAKLK